MDAYGYSEEHKAEIRQNIRENGRKKAGAGGAALAGVLLALKDIYQAIPPEEQITVVSDADGEPWDMDIDGFRYDLGTAEATSRPPEV